MMKTFKVLSALLSYPTRELLTAAPEFAAVLSSEALVPEAEREGVERLIEDIVSSDIYDLEERYCLLFDRSRALALYLFEHVHGESRDRGQAMVDLRAMYEEAGLTISANELPDYLPLFLEFLSTQPRQRARDLLGQTSHILAAIAARLEGRQSLYKAVFDALVAMARDAPAAGAVDELLKSDDDDPMDLTTLDAAWEEEEIRFGASSQQQACDRDSMIARLRHAKRAASSAPSP